MEQCQLHGYKDTILLNTSDVLSLHEFDNATKALIPRQ